MHRLGISIMDEENIDDILKATRAAGFDCVMMKWFDDEPVDEIFEKVLKNGLAVSSLHAPIAYINTFWYEGGDGDDYLEFMKKRVDFCKRSGLDKMILHVSFGNDIPGESKTGFDRFRRLDDYAESCGVHLCYENVNEVSLLKSVMEKTSAFHGFCWDIGHNLAYAPECDYNALFKGKLMYLHIHDNFGITKPGVQGKDMHLFPFDGNLDWQWYADTLKKLRFEGDLMLEPSYRMFLNSDLEEFMQKGYERVKKLRELF